MDALQKRTDSLWTLSWLPHGCSAKTDGVFVDVVMVATWMLCKNGREDALQKRKESFWTLSWLPHGCFAKNGRSLFWMLTWMDALQKRTESLWTLTWLPHGCFLAKNGVIKTRVCESIETLRKNGESPVKMQLKRLFQHKTRSKTAKTPVLDPRRATKSAQAKMSKRARTNNKNEKKCSNKPEESTRQTEKYRSRKNEKRVAGRRVSQLAKTTNAPYPVQPGWSLPILFKPTDLDRHLRRTQLHSLWNIFMAMHGHGRFLAKMQLWFQRSASGSSR